VSTELARWQFATTSIYHFLFVPVTIGLAFLVALLQTAWHRSDNPEYRRLTRFFGTLLLINVAVGVVTGLVQEFEFGMNWSAYARFVGDVFGGPLAMESLAAFALESTFLGLWLFGWDRLPKRIHLACIWMVSLGSALSALFIMIANSWMQHPVGYAVNHKTGLPELNNVWALFTNGTFIWGYIHVLLAALVTGSLVMLAVSCWHLGHELPRTSGAAAKDADEKPIDVTPAAVAPATAQPSPFKTTARLSVIVLVPSIILAMMVGSHLGVVQTKYQPMKIAAAEAQWETCKPCSFSAFQIGGGKHDETPSQIIEIPHLLSLLATGSWNGEVKGLHQVQREYEKKYGPGEYVPNVFISYWSMRVMAYLASLIALFALWGAWLVHRDSLDRSKWFLRLAPWALITPFLMNTAGWVLTENGRQPWIVQGLMKTVEGVSPSVSQTDVIISLTVFVLIYIALGAADVFLMLRYGSKELRDGDGEEPGTSTKGEAAMPALSY
jgi:cytochrome d ubiquinol oxidase subunit I